MTQIQPQTTFEYFLYTTVRLELGVGAGKVSIGTGFVYDHALGGGQKLPLLITNRHVVAGSQTITVRFHQRDVSAATWAVSGYVDLSLPLLEAAWTGHPDPTVDLVGIPLSSFQQPASTQGKEIAVQALGAHYIPDDLAVFDAIEDIVMIGYPIGLWDSTNNYPLLRRGITASHPGVDFNGKPVIAIDMACFPGSSGSPVLLPYSPNRTKPVPYFAQSRLFAFLGVLFSGPMHQIEGQVLVPVGAPIPTASTIPMNVGYIIKAREVATLAVHIAATHP